MTCKASGCTCVTWLPSDAGRKCAGCKHVKVMHIVPDAQAAKEFTQKLPSQDSHRRMTLDAIQAVHSECSTATPKAVPELRRMCKWGMRFRPCLGPLPDFLQKFPEVFEVTQGEGDGKAPPQFGVKLTRHPRSQPPPVAPGKPRMRSESENILGPASNPSAPSMRGGPAAASAATPEHRFRPIVGDGAAVQAGVAKPTPAAGWAEPAAGGAERRPVMAARRFREDQQVVKPVPYVAPPQVVVAPPPPPPEPRSDLPSRRFDTGARVPRLDPQAVHLATLDTMPLMTPPAPTGSERSPATPHGASPSPTEPPSAEPSPRQPIQMDGRRAGYAKEYQPLLGRRSATASTEHGQSITPTAGSRPMGLDTLGVKRKERDETDAMVEEVMRASGRVVDLRRRETVPFYS